MRKWNEIVRKDINNVVLKKRGGREMKKIKQLNTNISQKMIKQSNYLVKASVKKKDYGWRNTDIRKIHQNDSKFLNTNSKYKEGME